MVEKDDTGQTQQGTVSDDTGLNGLTCCDLLSPCYSDDYVTIYHGDCGKIMPHLGQFDLLLCDPPYGIEGNQAFSARENKGDKRWRCRTVKKYENSDWDKSIADEWLVSLARRISEKQIIFGGNYYDLPPSACWLIWDKEVTGGFADCEMAWTNLDKAARLKRYLWNGFRKAMPEDRYHPTQKPLAVMAWALMQAGDVKTCLDPWMGSGTTLRACKDAGVKCVGIEMQEKCCEIAAQRMLQEVLPLNEPTKAHHEVQEDLFQR